MPSGIGSGPAWLNLTIALLAAFYTVIFILDRPGVSRLIRKIYRRTRRAARARRIKRERREQHGEEVHRKAA